MKVESGGATAPPPDLWADLLDAIKKDEMQKRTPHSRRPEEERKHIVDQTLRLRKKGMSYRAIADELGIPRSTLNYYIGVDMSRGRYPVKLRNRAMQMRKQGIPQSEIARTLGLSETTIRRWTIGVYGGEPHPLTYWTEDRIIKAFKRWNAKYGRPPLSQEWVHDRTFHGGHRVWPDASTVAGRFGSWSRGVAAAGLTPHFQKQVLKGEKKTKTPLPSKEWTREEIIDLIQRWEEEHRLSPAQHEFNSLRREGKEFPSASMVARIFGSWNDAIQAAGLRVRPRGLTNANIARYLPTTPKKS